MGQHKNTLKRDLIKMKSWYNALFDIDFFNNTFQSISNQLKVVTIWYTRWLPDLRVLDLQAEHPWICSQRDPGQGEACFQNGPQGLQGGAGIHSSTHM